MLFTKRINIKMALLGTGFIGLLIFTNGVLMEYGLNKSVEFTYNAHYKEAESKLRYDIELLKDIVYKLADNSNVIDILEHNRSYDELDDEEKHSVVSEMHSFEGYLKNLIFIDTINIVSKPGNYLFTRGKISNNFDLSERSWFKNEYLNYNTNVIITDVHRDFSTGKYCISLVKFIYSRNNEELLGAAILDIFIDDLIESMNSDFYMGNLNTYIKIDDDFYYSKDGVMDYIKKSKNNYLVKLDDILKNGSDIILEFDKDSIIYTRELRSINRARIIVFTVAGVAYLLVLLYLIRDAFKPIMKSLDKLKILFNTLGKNDFELESRDEFDQLELISNSLSKSFDMKIQSLIYYDELTNLPNRKMLYKMCNGLINCNIEFALIFIDLNKFKYINDVFGHGAGDELLVRFSKKMDYALDNKGVITRYSGDEFIIIYNMYTNNNELEQFYEDVILNEFKNPVTLSNGKKVMIEFSAGAAIYPKDGESFNDLIDKSDFMMYSSKKSLEKGKLLFFNDDVYNKRLKIEKLKQELKGAVDRNELVLYYQPIVDSRRKVVKLESLIRWNSSMGFIYPGEFICYAEETGEIINIGYWTIEEVCRRFSDIFKSYDDNGDDIFQVSINISTIQLIEYDFADNVKKIADLYGIDMKRLCFEITESVVIDENIVIYENIDKLHNMGVSIALDDFGTGYASFSYLKKLKFDVLKIDKSIIGDSLEVDYMIIYNIKNIGHLLDMKIVIEGVETERQFEMLERLGCDYFQGYYFSRPKENIDEILN